MLEIDHQYTKQAISDINLLLRNAPEKELNLTCSVDLLCLKSTIDGLSNFFRRIVKNTKADYVVLDNDNSIYVIKNNDKQLVASKNDIILEIARYLSLFDNNTDQPSSEVKNLFDWFCLAIRRCPELLNKFYAISNESEVYLSLTPSATWNKPTSKRWLISE